MIGRRLSHYEIIELLGEGGMGRVYLAEDTELERKVALKVLPEDFAGESSRLQRFLREAKTVARLSHPNIVTIFSVEQTRLDGQDRTVHFLTMELVKGRQLSDLLRPGGLPVRQLLELAIPLADAVSAAHERGVTHRDLKPANMMVTDEGRLKVLDFGLAKITDPPPGVESASQLPTATLTAEGRILGTVSYMSPEQAEGKPLDHRSDIFSLGVVLSEMATGERPFRGSSSARIISAILNDEPRPPLVTDLRPEIPYHLARIIRQCLEKDPKDRYQTVRGVHNQLRQLRKEVISGRVTEPRVDTRSRSEAQPTQSREGAEQSDTTPGAQGAEPKSISDGGSAFSSEIERQVRRTATVLTWLGGAVVVLAVVTFLGFITSMAYHVSLGVPSDFSDDSTLDYLVWGIRALIPGLFLGVVSVLVLAGLWGVFRLGEWGLRALGVEGLTRARRAIAGVTGARLLSWTLRGGVVGIAAAIVSQRQLLVTIVNMDTVQASRAVDLGVLSTDSTFQHHLYVWCFAFVIAVVLFGMIRARAGAQADARSEERAAWALAGNLAIVLAAATIMVVPWRLLWSNNREVAWCGVADGGARKAFIIASSTEGEDCRHWLYFPDTRERRSFGCSEFDPSNGCRRSGLTEYVFGGSKPR
jgi:serine/threonine protein kinase